MSSIADALKRAQQERDRLKNPGESPATTSPNAQPHATTDTSLASIILRRKAPAATPTPIDSPLTTEQPTPIIPPLTPTPAPQVTPLTDAIRNAPQEPAPAVKKQQQVAETIVEDYTSKRNLNLPPAVVVYHERSGVIAEQYRHIRDALMSANTRRDPQLLVLTSTRPGEGKTVTTLNLGLSLVEIRANRVLLIDGCLHSPNPRTSLTNLLHLEAEPGLAELLSGVPAATPAAPRFATTALSAPQAFLKATPWHNLFILPAGARTTPGPASELLKSPNLAATFQQLRPNFDWILIDTPPAFDLPDAGLVGALAEGILLATALHRTPRAEVQTTIRRLKSMNLPLKSCILTHA